MHHQHTAPRDTDSSSSDPNDLMPHAEREVRGLAARAGYRTIQSMAKAAGVYRDTIVAAVQGKRKPYKGVVERIAGVLHVPPDVLDRLFEMARQERSR